MAVQEKKKAILDWVNNTNDNDYIEAIFDVIDSLSQKSDILDGLSPLQKEKIGEGLKDIENGHVTSHEEVKTRYGL